MKNEIQHIGKTEFTLENLLRICVAREYTHLLYYATSEPKTNSNVLLNLSKFQVNINST